MRMRWPNHRAAPGDGKRARFGVGAILLTIGTLLCAPARMARAQDTLVQQDTLLEEDAQTQRDTQISDTAPETGAMVDRITDDPERYIGKRVSVSGEIGDMRGDRTFTVEDDDMVFQDELLVISSRPLAEMSGAATVSDDDRVRVTGTLRLLSVEEVERDFDFDLDPEFAQKYREKPVLIANEITQIEEQERTRLETVDTGAVDTIRIDAADDSLRHPPGDTLPDR